MRISGGKWRGRRIRAPRTRGVRPTQDRVREALFSMLGERVRGARFLDLFAGSGAVGLEALSRGASDACWVERDARAVAVLKENMAAVGLGGGRVRTADVRRVLRAGSGLGCFDIVFADPPYRSGPAEGWLTWLLGRLPGSGLLDPEGCVIMEQAAAAEPCPAAGWSLLWDRAYGETRVLLYAPGDKEDE
jgi:16S rRNA (guanine966-N2)-methyltransferase